MIKQSLVFVMLILALTSTNTKAQSVTQPDSLGLPGDNLNLYAVMQLFQQSETLEGFEKSLNAEDSKINNLDLNSDDKIDYIRVVDNVNKDVHNIILQVPIDEKENQDVATFIVEKNNKGGVDIQLIGDEALYGKDYVVEPNYEDATITTSKKETPNPGYVKQSTQKTINTQGNTTIINNYTSTQTATWPIVSYMFMPNYVVWISPWRWSYYPSYWNSWTPWYWHRYYGYHYNYRYNYYRNYRICHYYRNSYVYHNYYSRRSTSVIITVNLKSGNYRKCYSHPESKSVGNRDYYRDSKNSQRKNIRVNPNTNGGKSVIKFSKDNSSNQYIHKSNQQVTNVDKDRSGNIRSNQHINIERRPVNRDGEKHSSVRGGRKRP